MSPLFATDIALAIVRHGCVCEHVVLLVSFPTVETYRVAFELAKRVTAFDGATEAEAGIWPVMNNGSAPKPRIEERKITSDVVIPLRLREVDVFHDFLCDTALELLITWWQESALLG